MFIIEKDIPANRRNSGLCKLEFGNFTHVMYIFTRHGHRQDARDLIEYPWSVLKLSVSSYGTISAVIGFVGPIISLEY